mgnify:CR=1 FL=1|tara:strand:+ start:899 stop:1144 length:246 start_codon:yes stop_codon:yes gene_type:complete
MSLKDEQVRGRIPRSATDEVIVKTGRYWNVDIIDIRWYKDGKHTSKGIRVNKAELGHLYNILGRIADGEQKRNRENDSETE